MANPEHAAKLNEGVEARNRWRKENSRIEPDLENANLARAHLENANFRDAHLEDTDLTGAPLENADLRGAHLESENLSSAHLENAILCSVNLTDANVGGLSYVGPCSKRYDGDERSISFRRRWWDWLRKNPIPYRRCAMRGRYQGIRGLSSCYGNRIFVRDAADQDYLDTIEAQLNTWYGRFAFWLWGLTDYGRSLMSVVVFASILISGFGFAYSHWNRMIDVGDRSKTLFTPYYFSIVTYTTLGFGDVKPHNLAGEIFVSIEVILGYVTLGLLLSVLGDKVARRS